MDDSIMKIVTSTSGRVIENGGIYNILKVFSEAGFDGADLGMFSLTQPYFTDNAEYRRDVLRGVKDFGIEIRQAHAPFPGYRFDDDDYNQKLDTAVRTAIQTAGDLGAHTIVVHPIHCPHLTTQQQMDWNMDYYMSLAPLAKSAGIRIALENMYGGGVPDRYYANVCSLPYEFSRYFDALHAWDRDAFNCCLDLGHFAMLGCSPQKAITEMGHDRVGALHVHDNNLVHDQHNPPYMGNVQWEEVAKALATIRYQGDFTFEPKTMYYLPAELRPAANRFLVEIGKYLISRIEYYQNQEK